MIEVPKIVGPVPNMIKSALDYLRTNVVKERIIKPKDKAESEKFFNYPYQAFEEAVVNALYHRDYQEREPVEIRVEPTEVTILSYAGPDRSISMEAIKKGKKLKARRYRNRRLGDFLKELDLTEGRATGIPTIQDELRKNGSSPARIETDDERTYFLMEIPCRKGFDWAHLINDPKNDPKTFDRQMLILGIISEDPEVSIAKLSELLSVSYATAKRDIAKLVKTNKLRRFGPKKGGFWEIVLEE